MRESRALVTSCNKLFAPGAEALLRSAVRFHPDIERYCYVPQDELDELRKLLGSLAHVDALIFYRSAAIGNNIPSANKTAVQRVSE
ncbi:MAG: hypothetical protein WCI03_11865 [bacterium]